jgi:hypothetical protein
VGTPSALRQQREHRECVVVVEGCERAGLASSGSSVHCVLSCLSHEDERKAVISSQYDTHPERDDIDSTTTTFIDVLRRVVMELMDDMYTHTSSTSMSVCV